MRVVSYTLWLHFPRAESNSPGTEKVLHSAQSVLKGEQRKYLAWVLSNSLCAGVECDAKRNVDTFVLGNQSKNLIRHSLFCE